MKISDVLDPDVEVAPGDVVSFVDASRGEHVDVEMTPESLEVIHRFLDGQNLYLTGKAGTGKSTLTRLLQAIADFQGMSVATTASTGIAAFEVDGVTLYRHFRMGVDLPTPEQIMQTPQVDEYGDEDRDWKKLALIHRQQTTRLLDVLFIDEISMVRADLFDVVVAMLRRYGPDPEHPTGGVQIVAIGDLYQLPPVVRGGAEGKVFTAKGYDVQEPYFYAGHSYPEINMATVELTKVFRQRDAGLVSLFNAVRAGRQDDEVMGALSGFVRTGFCIPDDEPWLILSGRNDTVREINQQRLNQFAQHSELITYKPQITGEVREKHPGRVELSLCEGAQVMLTRNHPHQAWVNGTIGTVVSLPDEDDPEGRVVIRTKKTRNGDGIIRVPRQIRGVYEYEAVDQSDGTQKLVRIQVGSISQFPLVLAWAMTVHKSQGQTTDRLILDTSGPMFANGMLYTALTRVTGPEGLVLTHTPRRSDIRTDEKVIAFMNTAGPDAAELDAAG